ncbi:MAG: cache domain-containing protein [Gammaproteobacteria bacterium]|nr:cache domain-containing protein [Gammaproteobacteria bacterium]
MSFKIRIILLALLPLLLLTAAIAWIGTQKARDLSDTQSRLFEAALIAAKQGELERYVRLAQSAIAPVLDDSGRDLLAAQAEVKRILTHLKYGEDGYFFVYDSQGVNLVHPIQKELVGRDLHELRDSRGHYVIRDLLDKAQQGGGFVRYFWNKPSARAEREKLGFVQLLPKWGWMLGSGLYDDDIATEVEKVRVQVKANVEATFTLILTILGLTTLLIVSLVFATNLREGRLANRRLQELAHNFVRRQVEERRRFSRDLHDGINQLMVAAKFRIELAQSQAEKGNEQYRESLSGALSTLQGAIKEVRRISHDLRPGLLDDMGLELALKDMFEQFHERSCVHVELVFELSQAALAPDVEITLYRVAQEALTNIERHAYARHVALQVRQSYNCVQLELRDDGCGFDPAQSAATPGIGLKNMRERIELLGGQFELHSVPAQGTRIRASLPLASMLLP